MSTQFDTLKLKLLKIRIIKCLSIICLIILPIKASVPMQPWQRGAFETGKYRNLFAEMGYSQQAIDAKLNEVFQGVFEGPNKVYFKVGDSLAYISDIKNHDVRTEGMSYGMMIAVQFNKKDIRIFPGKFIHQPLMRIINEFL